VFVRVYGATKMAQLTMVSAERVTETSAVALETSRMLIVPLGGEVLGENEA
jgi:hypothetical protein